MTAQPRYSLPTVPPALAGLVDLALDLRWSWSHSADALWEQLAPDLWKATGNPWHILQTISQRRLEQAATDPAFLEPLQRHLDARREILGTASWFERTHADARLAPVAYFSMEFGLSEALPIYSGGLGILAGDFIKAASDLGVPMVGIGLLWQQGYFRQALSSGGEQIEFFPFNDPGQLPIAPLRDAEGEWVEVVLPFPRRDLHLRAWEVRAGRLSLYLLDSNHLLNAPADRGITSELYGGGPEARLQQEIVLGIGGWRLLRELGIAPEVCHLNEGHAALAVLERARWYMIDRGVSFPVALSATRPGNLFTTHTPVEAGFDRFPPALVQDYLGDYATELGIGLDGLLDLGRHSTGEPLNMAYLAIRGSGAVNGVSRLHADVSRRLFQGLFPRWPRSEVPVGHVTNGVHVPSWDSEEADALWTRACGKERWLGDVTDLGDSIRKISDEELWAFRNANRRRLVTVAREHVARQGPVAGSLESLSFDPSCLCDPGVLTLGFARRFATYKRPDLLLHDPDRLERLLCGENSRVQLVLAGKAHPADGAGKAMVHKWTQFIARCSVRPHIIFLVDYDMGVAEHLVHGVDVWVNTPRRPWEASGTSGMKVLVNGGLNLSELDGWWAEAYAPDIGWALGDGAEHDSDPAWDAVEAGRLYDLLENEIIPEFYDRDEQGIPRRWIARVRESMARLTPWFSTNRMMAEYLERYYLPGAAAYRERTYPAPAVTGIPASPEAATGPAPVDTLAADIEAWRALLDEHWAEIRFRDWSVETKTGKKGASHTFRAEVDLGAVPPEAVVVEFYAEPLEGTTPERHVLLTDVAALGAAKGDTPGVYSFSATLPAKRLASDYTPRVVPWHPHARVPLEAGHILWAC
jgi:starch phosphorylase